MDAVIWRLYPTLKNNGWIETPNGLCYWSMAAACLQLGQKGRHSTPEVLLKRREVTILIQDLGGTRTYLRPPEPPPTMCNVPVNSQEPH